MAAGTREGVGSMSTHVRTYLNRIHTDAYTPGTNLNAVIGDVMFERKLAQLEAFKHIQNRRAPRVNDDRFNIYRDMKEQVRIHRLYT